MGTFPRVSNKAKGPDGLTDLQRKFCLEYVIDFNATQAYIRASGTENYKNANTNCWKLLQKPEVKAEIKRLQEMYYDAQMVNFERIGSELAKIAFGSDSEQNRIKALALLQKQLGLDKTVISADINQTVDIKVGIADDDDKSND